MPSLFVVLGLIFGLAAHAHAESMDMPSTSPSVPPPAPTHGRDGGVAAPSAPPPIAVGTAVAPRLCMTAVGVCAVGIGPANISCWCNTQTGPVGGVTQ